MRPFAMSSPLAWLRILVWTLALALPLQAQARLVMLSCAGMSPSASHTAHGLSKTMAETAAQALHLPPHPAHEQAGEEIRVHVHGSALAHPQAQTPPDLALSPALDDASSSHTCSACAVCCLGMALPSTTLHLGASFGAAVWAASPGPSSLDVVTATLERPPRVQQPR